MFTGQVLKKIIHDKNVNDIETISSQANVTVSDGLTYQTHTVYHDPQRAIFNSVSYNPSESELDFTGLPFSEVGIQAWDDNPWLPVSLKWTVNYFPLVPITSGGSNYSGDFVINNFQIGDTNLELSDVCLTHSVYNA